MSGALPKLAVLLVAVTLAGCGAGAAQRGGVRLRVTRDFGHQLVASAAVSRVPSGETARRLLAQHGSVRGSASGVDSIGGLAGKWSYYVNGSEGTVAPDAYALSPGDVVQWDLHPVGAAGHVPAIVGAYPEPFVHGFKGRRFPTRVECGDPASSACATVRDRLAAAGVIATGGELGSVTGSDTLRVVVARWSTAREIESVAQIATGPAISGVFARYNAAGTGLELLDGAGRPARAAPPGTGLVAATAQPGGATVWVVTGTDDAGVDRAARALSAAVLSDAFAVAVTPAGPVRLPVAG